MLNKNNSLSIFNHPIFKSSFVGFDDILDSFMEDTKVTYPPRNILRYKDGSYKIQLAVAGFSKRDITIKVEDGNKLIVTGENHSEYPDCEYISQGIANRKFTSVYQLHETLEVGEASLADGILTICINSNNKKSSVQTIDIN